MTREQQHQVRAIQASQAGLPGYHTTLSGTSRYDRQNVSPGTTWESRTGETRVTIVHSNSVWVWFVTEGSGWAGNADIDRFTRVYHQVSGGSS